MAIDPKKKKQRLAGGSTNTNTNVNNAGNAGVTPNQSNPSGRNAGSASSFGDDPIFQNPISGRNSTQSRVPEINEGVGPDSRANLRKKLDNELYFQDREIAAGEELGRRAVTKAISDSAKSQQVDYLGEGTTDSLPSNFQPIQQDAPDLSPTIRSRNTEMDTDTAFSNAGTIEAFTPEAQTNRAGFYSDNRTENEDGSSTIKIPGRGAFTSSKENVDKMINRMQTTSGVDYAKDPETGNVATGNGKVFAPSGKRDGIILNETNEKVMAAYDKGDISAGKARSILGGNMPSYSQNNGGGIGDGRDPAMERMKRNLMEQGQALIKSKSPSKAFDRARGNRMISQAMGIDSQNAKREGDTQNARVSDSNNRRTNNTSLANSSATRAESKRASLIKAQSEGNKSRLANQKHALDQAKGIRGLTKTKGMGGEDIDTSPKSRESSYHTLKGQQGTDSKSLAKSMFPEIFDPTLDAPTRINNLVSNKDYSEDTKLELYRMITQ